MSEFNVTQNPTFGYFHLKPIPTEEYISKFYKEQYYKLTSDSRLKRLLNDKKNQTEADAEIKWLHSTYFCDICYMVKKHCIHNDNIKCLDIGCGTGDLVKYMGDSGLDTIGIEPSLDAFSKAKEKKIKVYNSELKSFVQKGNKMKFNFVNLSNVLEHTRDPLKVIELCKEMLADNGIIRIQVPNDFNQFQKSAVKNLNLDKWWVSIPDHINYFNMESLIKILEFYEFDVIEKTVDFPMEVFLLMGENYINDNSLGKKCHEKRKLFENSISAEMRRKLYNSLANAGIGRNLIVYARVKK